MKTILITGASTGLGLAIAKHLHTKNFTVYGTSRKIQQEGIPFKTLQMDVTSRESVKSAIETIISEQGKIDVVINNAGLGLAGPVEHLQEEDMLNVYNTNVLGVLRVSQEVLPYMRKQKQGKIINISSIGSEFGLPYRGGYSSTKTAVDRLTEALRMEVKKFGVQACVVQPGGIQTDINANRVLTPLPEESPYKNSFDRCYKVINHSVSKGLKPEDFGPILEKIIMADKTKRIYRIGKFNEKLSVKVKRLAPDDVFEKIILNHYKI
ncbi:SDR family oxidoreductase [Cytophagaceae bacterium ABcell3]|nr:SDR family oxidoreductase [Cytophagaceae bacterium ABcell3]